MRTCQLCYQECLPVFYDLVTIALKHEAYLYVLRRKIGLGNMARLRHVAVGGFDNVVGSELSNQLPVMLEKLDISWKGRTAFYDTTPKSPLTDGQIKDVLDCSVRPLLKSSIKELWNKIPNLQIYLDVIVGNAPSAQV